MNDTLRAIAEVVRALAWPSVAVFAAVFFRKEIAELSRRLRKGGGAEFDPPAQVSPPAGNPLTVTNTEMSVAISKTASSTLEAFPKTLATASREKMILDWDVLKNVNELPEREQVLVRLLARAVLVIQFEKADSSIWASQLDLLSYLNARRQGESLPQLKALFYDRAAGQYPSWYANYSFESWLDFLRRSGLINVANGTAIITQEGVEYLAWRVEQARPPKLQG